jgi:hypothetical protein
MIYKISLAWIRGPDFGVSALVKKVDGKMTGNALFTTPEPPLADIVRADASFQLKVAAMAQGGTQATQERDAARAVVESKLRALLLYAEKIALGDPIVMLSAGFDIYSSAHEPTTPDTPVIQKAEFGNKDQVILRWGSKGNAVALKVRYRIPGGPWMEGTTSSQPRSITQGDLISGQMYEFQIQAVGTNNQLSDWSDYVSQMAP